MLHIFKKITQLMMRAGVPGSRNKRSHSIILYIQFRRSYFVVT